MKTVVARKGTKQSKRIKETIFNIAQRLFCFAANKNEAAQQVEFGLDHRSDWHSPQRFAFSRPFSICFSRAN